MTYPVSFNSSRLDRNVQAVVDGVVEFPEPDHAGEFDDLRRRQMLLQPLQDLVGHRGRILGRRAHVVEAGLLHLVGRLVVAGDDVLQLLFAHVPALETGLGRLLQHRAAMRGAIGAAVGGAGDGGELALEQLIECRGRIAHDFAVERPQRLGDFRPVGVELERVRQKPHALLVRIEHGLEPRIEILLLHVRNEGLRFDQNFRLRRGYGVHDKSPSQR